MRETKIGLEHTKQLTFTSRILASAVVWSTLVLTALGQSAPARCAINNQNRQQNFGDTRSTTDKTPKPATTPQTAKQLKIGKVNFSGSLRLRVENHSWFETPGFEDDYTFGAALLRLSLSQQRDKFDWMIEGEFPVLLNLPEHAVAPTPQGQLGLGGSYFAASGRQDASAVLKQGYVRLILGHFPNWPIRGQKRTRRQVKRQQAIIELRRFAKDSIETA